MAHESRGAGEQKMEVNLKERKEFCGVQLGFRGLGLGLSVAGLKPAQTRRGRGVLWNDNSKPFFCVKKKRTGLGDS